MCYYTTVCVQVWQPDSGLALGIIEGNPKEMPDMKSRRAVRCGRTSKFIETTGTLQDGPHTCLLCGTQVNLPIPRVF